MTEHKISWLNMPGYKPETWNPIIGCNKISPGCDNCWAEKMAIRQAHMSGAREYSNVVRSNPSKWNGKTQFVESALHKPLYWKNPRMIFVCDMGDLFHETVKYEWFKKVMNIIEMSPEHIFIILTKRPERAAEFLATYRDRSLILISVNGKKITWPFSNLWVGASTENQEQFNKRVPLLLKVPAAKRFVSIEPMLGPIDFYDPIINGEHYHTLKGFGDISGSRGYGGGPALDWIIVGGESGPKARPIHPDWVRSVRDQCAGAGTPFFFKQWGEWLPLRYGGQGSTEFNWCEKKLPYQWMCKVGCKAAGDLLDGKQHHEWPKINK